MIFDVNVHLEELKQLLIKELPTSLPEQQVSKHLESIKEKAEQDAEEIKHLREQLKAQKELTETATEMLNIRNEQIALFNSILNKLTSPNATGEGTPLS
ncbi:MAG: hypothetical protein ABS904_01000 [Solibacillus isronensis]